MTAAARKAATVKTLSCSTFSCAAAAEKISAAANIVERFSTAKYIGKQKSAVRHARRFFVT